MTKPSAFSKLAAIRSGAGDAVMIGSGSAIGQASEARANCAKWLDDVCADGWTAEDRADYLRHLADEMRDLDRAALARSFWALKSAEINARQSQKYSLRTVAA